MWGDLYHVERLLDVVQVFLLNEMGVPPQTNAHRFAKLAVAHLKH
jgi:hypothetical protein